MRVVVMSSIVVVTVGCGISDPPETNQVESAVKCPDPDSCTYSNGGGVYTEELGKAEVGNDHFMIMRFINQTGGGVNIRGRYLDAVSNQWFYDTTTILSAWYAGNGYLPFSVEETGTTPLWTLVDDSTGQHVQVSGDDLLSLRLTFKRNTGDYTLRFNSATKETRGSVALHEYNMQWTTAG